MPRIAEVRDITVEEAAEILRRRLAEYLGVKSKEPVKWIRGDIVMTDEDNVGIVVKYDPDEYSNPTIFYLSNEDGTIHGPDAGYECRKLVL